MPAQARIAPPAPSIARVRVVTPVRTASAPTPAVTGFAIPARARIAPPAPSIARVRAVTPVRTAPAPTPAVTGFAIPARARIVPPAPSIARVRATTPVRTASAPTIAGTGFATPSSPVSSRAIRSAESLDNSGTAARQAARAAGSPLPLPNRAAKR